MAKIIRKFYTLYKTATDTNDYFWIKNESSSSNTVELRCFGGGYIVDKLPKVEYSIDKITWNKPSLYLDKISVNLNEGEKVYFRNSSGSWVKDDSWVTGGYFKCSDNFSAGGDIRTLIDYTFVDGVVTIPDYSFKCILSFDSTTMSKLKAVDLKIGDSVRNVGKNSFFNAFYYNSAPTNLESFKFDMKNVVSAGDYSFQNLLRECTNLTTLQMDMSSLETVGRESFQNAFNSLTSITSLPDFPSLTTTGQNSFNNAFAYNPLVTTPPDMSSLETLGSYSLSGAFRNSGITEGVDLSNVTSWSSYSLADMYMYCADLAEVTAPNVSQWNTYNAQGWLMNAGTNVSGTKTVNCPTGLTIPTDSNSGIPTGWTRTDY